MKTLLGVVLHDCHDHSDTFFKKGEPIKENFDRIIVGLVYEHGECITMGATVANFWHDTDPVQPKIKKQGK